MSRQFNDKNMTSFFKVQHFMGSNPGGGDSKSDSATKKIDNDSTFVFCLAFGYGCVGCKYNE